MTKNDWGKTACRLSFRNGRIGSIKDTVLRDVNISVGRKYITDDYPWKTKFEIETGIEVSVYSPKDMIFPTREQAEMYKRSESLNQELAKYLSYTGQARIKEMTLEERKNLLVMFRGNGKDD